MPVIALVDTAAKPKATPSNDSIAWCGRGTGHQRHRDESSHGVNVEVCSTAPSSFAKDGRTKVDDAVWAVIVQDPDGSRTRRCILQDPDIEPESSLPVGRRSAGTVPHAPVDPCLGQTPPRLD